MKNSKLLLIFHKALYIIFLALVTSVCSGREVPQADLNRALQTISRNIPTAQPQHPGNVFLFGEDLNIKIPESTSSWRVLDEHRAVIKKGSIDKTTSDLKIHGLGIGWYWGFLRGDRKAVPVADLEHESKRFTGAISARKVKDALIAALLRGSGEHRCQLALYEACRALPKPVLEEAGLGDLIATIRQQSESPELHQALDDASQIERLLVTANVLFNYLRRQDGEPLAPLAEAIDRIYRFDDLPVGPELTNVP